MKRLVYFFVCAFLVPPTCAMEHSAQNTYNPEDLRRARAGDKNLVGANLQGAELQYIDLSDADLTNANLSNAKLNYVTFKHTKLIRTNMRHVTLVSCNFNNAFLDHIDLSNAILKNCWFIESDIICTNLSHTYMKSTRFTDSIIRDVDFSESKFNGCGFSRSHLDNVNMQKSFLLGYTINTSSLQNIDLRESKIQKSNFDLFSHTNRHTENTWTKINLSHAVIIDSWFLGDLALLFDKEEERIPELDQLKPSWFYKLALCVNPFMAAKRMLNDNYDKYNVNSVFVESNFEGTLFLGTAFTNIALKNCSGIDSLRTRKRCGFINVVITDTEHNQTYAIPNDEDFRHPW